MWDFVTSYVHELVLFTFGCLLLMRWIWLCRKRRTKTQDLSEATQQIAAYLEATPEDLESIQVSNDDAQNIENVSDQQMFIAAVHEALDSLHQQETVLRRILLDYRQQRRDDMVEFADITTAQKEDLLRNIELKHNGSNDRGRIAATLIHDTIRTWCTTHNIRNPKVVDMRKFMSQAQHPETHSSRKQYYTNF